MFEILQSAGPKGLKEDSSHSEIYHKMSIIMIKWFCFEMSYITIKINQKKGTFYSSLYTFKLKLVTKISTLFSSQVN